LQFLVLELLQPNLVLLDEPTNHMDLEGCEALEESLLGGETTVLFVSHDRRFVSNVATRWFAIAGGKLVEVDDFEHYVAELGPARATLRRAPASSGAGEQAAAPVLEPSASPDAILERILELEQKLQADRQRKLRHQKPSLQAAWQSELTELYARLG
jgi:ABC-type multidrug transport system ATPase subunit